MTLHVYSYPRRLRSTRRRRRRIPGAAGGRSVIDHAASTQSVIFNKKSMNTYMYDLRKYISIYLSIYIKEKNKDCCDVRFANKYVKAHSVNLSHRPLSH